jgi:PleD family two-component response regulator
MSDPLTGVANPRYFPEHLSRELKRLQRVMHSITMTSSHTFGAS